MISGEDSCNILDKQVIHSILSASFSTLSSIEVICISSSRLFLTKTVTTFYDSFGRTFSVIDPEKKSHQQILRSLGTGE
ncbi:MAG: hypothetical protein OXC48_06850 [Endozoicomonadaceae bacterium]|nr:hypothetical protein [Endozoicomonadaceae bacterium]